VTLGLLSAVIVLLTAFGVWSEHVTSDATSRSLHLTRLSHAFQRAQSAVDDEQSLARKYRLEPSSTVRANYADATRDFSLALMAAERLANAADRALVRRLRMAQRGFLSTTDRMFSAVDTGDPARVRQIVRRYSDHWFAATDTQVDAAAASHRAVALASLITVRERARFGLVAMPIAAALAIVLVWILALQLSQMYGRLRRQADAVRDSALHDPLTGLPNSTLFSITLEEQIGTETRHGSAISMLMIDLDRFKEINDTHGHGTGDRLLRAIGPRLAHELGPRDLTARLGGDEFAILLRSSGPDTACEVARRLRHALQTPFQLGDVTLHVDASVGIASFPDHGADAATIVQHADVAMYIAKRGGDGIAVYDAATDPYSPERLALLGELREAIAEDQLELHYQPKFRTTDLHVTGVEALIRWHHPARGLLPPDEFIGLAEHTGLIKPLTDFVLRSACRQWSIWKQTGLDMPIAVNLAAANLLDTTVVDDIAAILREERMPANRLHIELTESMVMSDPDRAIDQLSRLAALGITLAIDDFGTGHSSLAYLRRLPVNELKIDRSFIHDLPQSRRDIAIVRSTIDLAHSLGLRVVAEGLEDAAALETLRHLACDEVQGYYLCRPTPPEFLKARLARLARVAPAVEDRGLDLPHAA
jgi:diguanylate cyclase (GGDEF)-like protein